MKIKIIPDREYLQLEAEFGAKVCFYDLNLEVALVRAMSCGPQNPKYVSSSALEQAIEDILTYQKVKNYLSRPSK
jgi:hypothetical protein